MAAALQSHSPLPHPPHLQRQKHKEDVALANLMGQQAQHRQDVWVYQHSAMPVDWSLYQQQQIYAQANSPYAMYSNYYQHAHYPQQMLYGPSVPQHVSFAPSPAPPPAPPSQHQPLARAPTPNACLSGWGESPRQIPRSASTPIPSTRPRDHAQRTSAHLRQQHEDAMRRRANHRPSLIHSSNSSSSNNRPSSTSSSTSSSLTGVSSDVSTSDRRSSITSVSSTMSELSISSKTSFTNRLRRVFGKSKPSTQDMDDNGSVVSSVSHKTTTSSASSRRRSIASFSSLFQKSSVVVTEVPAAKVITTQVTAASSSGSVDASHRRSTVASPSPQRASNKGVLVCHDSPTLRPLPSSRRTTESLAGQHPSTQSRIQFCPTIQVHETFPSDEYDRRCDNQATCQKLTPRLAMKIKQELNEYKLHEMDVHQDSRRYTHFFLRL